MLTLGVNLNADENTLSTTQIQIVALCYTLIDGGMEGDIGHY